MTKRQDDTATITAQICGVSDSLVRKVTRGERNNDVVMVAYMELWERKQDAIEKVTEIVENLKKQGA
jgi:predicted nucleotidyltransferase